MIYSFIHSFYYRVLNKLKRIRKRRQWDTVPQQQDTTFFNSGYQLFDPHLVGSKTLGYQMTQAKTVRKVLEILENLTPNEPSIEFVKKFYKKGLDKFGDDWNYGDINTALFVISKNLSIENYLEIGVRRGRSMAVLASQSPEASIFGFDLWIEGYGGSENPGESLVKEELTKVNFSGKLELIEGDSKKTIPSFFKKNKDLYFDVITVDGDHSIGGAVKDLKNVISRLKIGGILVFDDISSQEHPYLNSTWEKVIKRRDNFYSFEYSDLGLGVAIAIRKY